jgi:Domain of unknown function (DUF4411)
LKAPSIYVLDADVFITAKNTYYAFDICPGFWAGILRMHKNGSAFSVSRVRNELLAGTKTENLVQWVRNQLPEAFFLEVETDPVASAYTEVMLWIQRHTRYTDGAKAKFATGADGWLVAYAKVNGAIVVTNEQPAPEAKVDIKLPDVCQQFNVPYKDTFVMLRELAVQFNLAEVK